MLFFSIIYQIVCFDSPGHRFARPASLLRKEGLFLLFLTPLFPKERGVGGESTVKQDIMLLPNYHAFYQKSNKVSETLQPCNTKVSFA
jgi:hypothetical protein